MFPYQRAASYDKRSSVVARFDFMSIDIAAFKYTLTRRVSL